MAFASSFFLPVNASIAWYIAGSGNVNGYGYAGYAVRGCPACKILKIGS